MLLRRVNHFYSSAMVVNIDRPWLYTELFNDFELDVADHIL